MLSHAIVTPVADAIAVAVSEAYLRILSESESLELGFLGTLSPREAFKFFTAGEAPRNARWQGRPDGLVPNSVWAKAPVRAAGVPDESTKAGVAESDPTRPPI